MVYLNPHYFSRKRDLNLQCRFVTMPCKLHRNSSPLFLFPFISFDLTSDKGVLYGINRHNSSLVLLIDSLETITHYIAKSGAGKSYMTKLEILRPLMFDTEVIVLGPEREYQYLAEAVVVDI